jgi:hypothetical protein
VHAGVVGGDDDEPAVHAQVRRGEERIGGHVHADVLHGGEGAAAAELAPTATSSATFSLGDHSQ